MLTPDNHLQLPAQELRVSQIFQVKSLKHRTSFRQPFFRLVQWTEVSRGEIQRTKYLLQPPAQAAQYLHPGSRLQRPQVAPLPGD